MTLNDHNLAVKKMTKAFVAYTKVLQKYFACYDTHTNTFEDFVSALGTLSNAGLTCQVIDPIHLKYILRAIPYDLKKISPNFELVFTSHAAIMQHHWFHLQIVQTSC